MENVKDIGFGNNKAMNGEEVVISGLSGVFPNSDSVLEFSENLYNKVDMVSDDPRWTTNDPEIPQHVGKISDIDKFDAQFFRVGYQQAKVLEPISKKVLEHAYGAIFDSGNTHATLKGMKIGVYIGMSFADYCTQCSYDIQHPTNFCIGGSSKSMIANRISYWIDGRGPSYHLDFSCASSTAALEKAYLSIKNGECDAAVVGSGNNCSHQMLSLNLRKAGFLCLDGKTKCFDKNADGYVRAEAVSLMFLQKAKDAKRIYAEVCHVKGKYALKPDDKFSPFRKSEEIQRFLTDFYSETDIRPEAVEYVEANGAANAKADLHELDAIGNFFASDKTVKIGCVKSNMGHSEATSGLTAVTKLCLAYHRGELPANLHYADPPDVSAVQDGRLQVLTERTKFDRGYAALNNFSFTGANFHVVLKGHYKEKNLYAYKSQIPRIVLASGRAEPGVNKIFDSLKNRPIDEEEIALLYNIFEHDIVGHTGRGFTILETNNDSKAVSVIESVNYYSGVRRPLWFVFSGMGSQWAGMGADFMRIPTFRKAIERCHKVLESRGVDVIKIISEPDKTIFDNILNAFVGICAVQIGLTDILKEMGVEPDYIIGHSLGEMACAYHDNTFTLEEMILATYSRGKAVVSLPLVQGSMAAVGVGYKDIQNYCPPEIDIGCHNSSESSTISGPAEVVKEFVTELTKRGIFAREVPSAGVAYHSRYIADAGPALLQSLRDVIKHPKLRSKKWISTSVPKERWDSQNAKYSSPEYHTNNLLSPVLFEEMMSEMPSNAVVVEIAPHGLLQAILKRSHPDCIHIPLTRRGCPDSVKFLLEGIGKLYQAGYNPKVDTLYPKVELPVSTETPFLSHLVEWDHSESWPVLELDNSQCEISPSVDLIISLHDDDHSYISDNVINGVAKIPESALLVYVWKALAMNKYVDFRNLSVMFRDIEFHSDVVVLPETSVKLSIMISRGNEKFEITQDDILVVTGIISDVKHLKLKQTADFFNDDFDDIRINSKDIYKMFSMRGFSYNGVLKSIHSININQNNAYVKWTNDWIPFLDSLIQLNVLMGNYNGITKPKFIRNLKISVIEQGRSACKLNDINGIDCHNTELDTTLGITRCAGVEINDITFVDQLPVVKEPSVIINKSFFPFFAIEQVEIKTALEVIMQIVAENASSKYIRIIKSISAENAKVFKNFHKIADLIPEVVMDIKSSIADDINTFKLDTNVTNVLVYENLFNETKMLANIKNQVTQDDFIVTLENQLPKKETEIKNNYSILACMSDGKQILMLLKKHDRNKRRSYFSITIENNFSWVSRVRQELIMTNKVVLIAENLPYSGLLGFVKKIKLDEMDGHVNISLLEIQDIHAQKFNKENIFYKEQLEKNMTVNILKKGQWGGYYYTSCVNCLSLRSFTLNKIAPGNIDELTWVEAPPRSAKNLLVQVFYSGLSLNDCYKAIDGFKNNNEPIGMDFSGIDKNGDRVMGILPGSATSSSVEADSDLLWPVPDHWNFEEAATVPVPYIHAYYCLVVKAKLKKGQIVLVTGGAGALGQAVISLTLALECIVFTTVSTMQKKNMLLRRFPLLNDNNISYSDDDSVHTMVMVNTQKQGCHLVINSATGALRSAAMKCVRFQGSFLDITKHEMIENKDIGMSYLKRERSYCAVDLSNIFKPQNVNDKKILHHCLSEGIARGIVTPLTRIVYSPTLVSRAFKLLSTRKNIGRVLLRLRDPAIMNKGLTVSPRLTYNPQDVAIVVCDASGLGIALADKLIERGASKIILHIDPSAISGYVQSMFISWSKREVSVKLYSENLRTEQGCATLMKNAMKFGKVKAVFIVLDGEEDNNGEKDDFINAYNKKCSVVLNLDLASRNCAEIIHFTIVASLTQNSSDEYALSVLERVSERRHEMGLPALVIRHESLAELNEPRYCSNKLRSQSISTFFNSTEISLKLKYNNVLTFDLKEDTSGFCKKISRILGVRDIEDLENGTTLLQLNLDEIPLNELRATIKRFYQIDYPLEKISGMTIKSLKSLSKIENKRTTDFDCGLAAFYKDIESEVEYLLQEPVIVMPTSNSSTKDLQDTHLIMIPGFDGRCETLKTIAERLKINAVGVQLGPDLEGDSVREMAQNIKKLLKTKLETQSKFYILGYSFGVNIALELAAILEEEGQKGIVFCLDSSPDALRSHLDAYLGKLPEDKLQNNILSHIYCLMNNNKNKELTEELDKLDTIEEKIEMALKKLKGAVSNSEQYKRHVLESANKRINLAREYKPRIKLESELILLKGIAHPNSENLAQDYNLSQYTKIPIKVFELNSDHGYAYQDLRVSNIINKQLF